MLRLACVSMFIALLVSCSRSSEPPKPPEGTKAPEVKTTAPAAATSVKDAVGEKTATAVPAAIPDATAVLDSGFGVDKLKSVLGSFSVDNLKDLAAKLGEAVKKNDGVVSGLKDQITKLGLTDPAKLGELTKTLESSSGVLTALKGKLQVVVTALKEKGIDVSQFTSLLGG
jgi:hypothetical protein